MSIKTKFYFILLGFGLAVVLSTISSYFVIKSITTEYDSTLNNAKANQVLLGELNSKFEEHKQFIETVVGYANDFATKNEGESRNYQSQSAVFIKDMISQNNLLLLSVNLIILIILSYITLQIITKFVKSLNPATTRLANISDGNF